MDRLHEMTLTLSPKQEDALMARMAVGGLGMLAGMDPDTIADLQMVVNECIDCLMHQQVQPEKLQVDGYVETGRLVLSCTRQGMAGNIICKPLDLDIVRGVLETLMPQVELCSDEYGVCRICCSIAV